MANATGRQGKRPDSINGFRVGDRVITPLGRVAIIKALRSDHYIEAEYEGYGVTTRETILQPHGLKLYPRGRY